jgi:Rrf2 family protein
MQISARSDYALRALLTLAAADDPMTADELASAQALPTTFLESILLDLRRGGILASRRGRVGGYRFARDPEQVTPADVIRILDGPLAEVRGERPENTSYADAAEPLQQLWVALRANMRTVLEGVSIGELARGQLPRKLARLVDDPDAWTPR